MKSHLLQMRGLKPVAGLQYHPRKLSHLLQMRGLKLLELYLFFNLLTSHLLQMRGLKQLTKTQAEYTEVASFTDAWIETPPRFPAGRPCCVASFTDAWIET